VSSNPILVTGAQGFIGSSLIPSLKDLGHEVHAATLDLLDFESIEKCIQSRPWGTLVHLAAISHVPTCEKNPALAYQTNLNGTAFLLEAVKRHCPQIHLVFASTAQVYAAPQGKEITDGVVFDEERTILPQNLYARTKWQSELLIKDASEKLGLKATVLRLFNHTHRSQSPDFFLPHLYAQMTSAKPNSEISIPVGNLDLDRDVGSVKDLISAMVQVIQNPSWKFETFNVCSGTSKNLGKLAREMAEMLKVRAEFIVDPARVRTGEPKSLIGSHEKLTRATGWVPQCRTESELLKEFIR
jgi:GDP-4-dehydro-6-deoxy-D-mannose reductase